MNFAEILVYVLAIVLAIFLILAIILVVMLIRVTKQIRDVTASAGRTIGSVEKVVGGLSSVTTATGLMKLASNYVKKRRKKS